MKIDNTTLKKWKKHLDPENVYYDAKEIGSDVRTVKNALATGKCSKPVYDKINNFVDKKISPTP